MKRILKGISLILIGSTIFTSCKDEFLETTPTQSIAQETVFTTTAGALVALNGTYRSMYTSLTNHGNFGQKSYEIVSDLLGKDIVVHQAGYGWFNTDYQYTAIATAATNQRSERTWFYYYRTINNANIIIANIDNATGTQTEKDYIKGQALALRAYSYFYLVNFFQQTYKGNETKPGVPLYTAPTSVGNPRGTVQQVYTQMIEDLKAAETLLTGKTRQHKSHINVNTAQGILARVALQMEDWPTARDYARKARGTIAPMSTTLFTSGFSALSNAEWIWGLEVNIEQSTIFASYFSHMDNLATGYGGLGSYKKMTKELYDQIPVGDVRKEVIKAPGATTNSALPFYTILKFKKPTAATWNGDYLLLRAGEMYLIEAEACARIGGADEATALTVLNTLVRARYPAYNFVGVGSSLLNEILLQRRIELFGEGFSYNDIKRLKQGLNRPTGPENHGGSFASFNSTTSGAAGTNFDPARYVVADGSGLFLFRIPQDEINNNRALTPADQNPTN